MVIDKKFNRFLVTSGWKIIQTDLESIRIYVSAGTSAALKTAEILANFFLCHIEMVAIGCFIFNLFDFDHF